MEQDTGRTPVRVRSEQAQDDAPWCPWHGGHIPAADATIVAAGPTYACRTCMALHRMRPLGAGDPHPHLPRPPFIGRRDGLPLRPAARS